MREASFCVACRLGFGLETQDSVCFLCLRVSEFSDDVSSAIESASVSRLHIL